jgi:hypothetical protein
MAATRLTSANAFTLVTNHQPTFTFQPGITDRVRIACIKHNKVQTSMDNSKEDDIIRRSFGAGTTADYDTLED